MHRYIPTSAPSADFPVEPELGGEGGDGPGGDGELEHADLDLTFT
jgi:hypothetical protein